MWLLLKEVVTIDKTYELNSTICSNRQRNNNSWGWLFLGGELGTEDA
jgi:hypothetical protein